MSARPVCRIRKREVYDLIILTESFTWEDLPTRHPDTGRLTNAGYIQKIPDAVKKFTVFAFIFNGTQCIIRMVHSHEMVFSEWYPFDASVSPGYELANLSQVFRTFILFIFRIPQIVTEEIFMFNVIKDYVTNPDSSKLLLILKNVNSKFLLQTT
jgi:hypothetical protein